MSKLKGCRHVDEINKEYGQVCATYGDLAGKMDTFRRIQEQLLKRMEELSLENKAYQEQMEKKPDLKIVPPSEPTSLEPSIQPEPGETITGEFS